VILCAVIAEVLTGLQFAPEKLLHDRSRLFHTNAHVDLDVVFSKELLSHDAHTARNDNVHPIVGQETWIRSGLMDWRIQKLDLACFGVVIDPDHGETLTLAEMGTGLPSKGGDGKNTFHDSSPAFFLLSSNSSRTIGRLPSRSIRARLIGQAFFHGRELLPQTGDVRRQLG